jgi:radical SAM superfamily enzyme YgiQ (UPF0313 family)
VTATYRHILLVYPEFPKTYWGMQYSLTMFGKKAVMPPLGLITIAAMTPAQYEFRLVDMNCRPLTADDLAWADMVCFSAMLPQKESLFKTAARCKSTGKLVVFGGPFPTACPDECRPYCDVQVLNEGEITWPLFLKDLAQGIHKNVYTSETKPDVTTTPIPRFDLLRIEDYTIIPIQFSRGCPFQCEFCDIIVMFGRRPRTKTAQQLCAELQALLDTGYRGIVFIVDDNFIGNKREVKRLLPQLKAWNDAHGRPFLYVTEATVNLADDADLIRQMVEANFQWVFVGIETPSAESLKETMKYQNTKRALVDSVKAIQSAGLVVYGGFILGFDNDTQDIFERQIEFINETAIAIAMVGLLVAIPGTPLYKRMHKTGRLKSERFEGNHDQCGYTNIVTTMSEQDLLAGYKKIIATIYTPEAFFKRTLETLRRLPRPGSLRARLTHFNYLRKLWQMTSMFRFLRSVSAEYRNESLKFTWSVLRKAPDHLPSVMLFVVMGLHLYRFTFEDVIPELDRTMAQLAGEGTAQKLA